MFSLVKHILYQVVGLEQSECSEPDCGKKKEKDSEFFCVKHCQNGILHQHCSVSGCDIKKEDGNPLFCSSHCETSGHFHCTSFGCSSISHHPGGEGIEKCTLHCEKELHGHCIANGCGKKTTNVDQKFCRGVYKNDHGICHLNLDGFTPEYI